jgi:hypothetical protein
VYPSRRHLSAKVRVFAEFLIQRFATPGWALDDEPDSTAPRSRKGSIKATGSSAATQVRDATLGNDQRRRRLASHFLKFAHRRLDTCLRRIAILRHRIGQIIRVDFEIDRQRSHVGEICVSPR